MPLRDDWLVFNNNGAGLSILLNKLLEIPEVSIPILDIKSMNRSVAVLSKDHILILNAQYKYLIAALVLRYCLYNNYI